MDNKTRISSILIWAWIVAVMAAYLFQFRHLAGPILDKLASF
ncbi:MAG: hypothetical protein QGI63_06855 [Rhodospirillales bacterium]|jgi:hypothetical protein|nr:hypothetical protein [Rhodospirillales bacterium]MDP6572796.1 hypothetical protein [Rhodospirillales bacterium]MDP6773973.1 hypothetical protein [Rhodospirillales bacterium]HJO73343.1 hypothetical protein [Rhodospirillales bacterium]